MSNLTEYKVGFQGKTVFVELTAADIYDLEKVVPVFEERGTGELIMHEATVADLDFTDCWKEKTETK